MHVHYRANCLSPFAWIDGTPATNLNVNAWVATNLWGTAEPGCVGTGNQYTMLAYGLGPGPGLRLKTVVSQAGYFLCEIDNPTPAGWYNPTTDVTSKVLATGLATCTGMACP